MKVDVLLTMGQELDEGYGLTWHRVADAYEAMDWLHAGNEARLLVTGARKAEYRHLTQWLGRHARVRVARVVSWQVCKNPKTLRISPDLKGSALAAECASILDTSLSAVLTRAERRIVVALQKGTVSLPEIEHLVTGGVPVSPVGYRTHIFNLRQKGIGITTHKGVGYSWKTT